MAEKSVKLRADQPIRRYVGIDVTEALDTIAFGNMWNAKFGWSNLLWSLKKDPADSKRRIDAAHPKLPIKRLGRSHGGTTYADECIMPENIDGVGPDANYTRADLAASDQFMHTFILQPSADAASSSLNDNGTGVVADIVYVSSHGFNQGEMFSWVGWPGSSLFLLREMADRGGQFAFPGWLVLANCATLSAAAHGDWLKVMSGTTPLRGVVGFQHTCPLPGGSVEFASVFIDRLGKGQTILNAWKEAVTVKVQDGDKDWIVLCHEDAKDDTIADWNDGKLKPIAATSKILRFDSTVPNGTPLVPVPDPFEAFWSKGATRITASNITNAANHINAGDAVSVTVKPEKPATTFIAGQKINVTVVYIRRDYNQAIDITAMFKVVGQTGASAPTTAHMNTLNPAGGGPDTWQLTVQGTPSEVVLSLQCVDFSSLGHAAMPLRLYVDNGTTQHQFADDGSVFER